MKSHNCVIGLLLAYEDTHLVTLDGLKEHIQENIRHNEWLDKDPVFRNHPEMKAKVTSLSDYADKRKSNDLTQFAFCPACGQKIDWKGIKSGTEI